MFLHGVELAVEVDNETFFPGQQSSVESFPAHLHFDEVEAGASYKFALNLLAIGFGEELVHKILSFFNLSVLDKIYSKV